ncbi:PepSY-associated TM helix domain-containing protein [Barnesiella sp. An22]|uniref:PepSY-associated TM helix domain-containing protein n=1 Tax=Barnesiella sp. An22 TaxID=1965590 RepID=UPI000B393CFD|nr:PepSY-associated TM helix domain-containing protein [Barnesiella sp. An22]OUO97903.1 iron transporter [Barnesiella sp. An22]
MKKTFRKIHLWLAVPFGLIITIICFTGALLVFEDQVTQLTNRHLYYVESPGSQPLPVGTLVEKVESQLTKGATITGVTIYPQPDRSYQVNLSAPKGAAVYIDPYTGEVLGQSQRTPFFRTVFMLHRWLLDSQPADGGIFWGKRITGISTLLFVIILLSGIVIWWPRSRKGLKNGIQIALRKGKARFWHDLHAAGGIYVLLLVLVMALTGLTWSFDWYKNAFYTLFGVETTAPAKGPAHKEKSPQGPQPGTTTEATAPVTPFACWQQVYNQVAAENPDRLKIEITDGTASVSNNRYGNIRGTDRYTFDPQSGQITGASLYKDTGNSGKIRGWIYSVHTGAWGGNLTRIIWFLAALLGATLPLTGYYLWIKRLYRKRHNRAVH